MLYTTTHDIAYDIGEDELLDFLCSAAKAGVFVSCERLIGPAGGNPELRLVSTSKEKLLQFIAAEDPDNWRAYDIEML